MTLKYLTLPTLIFMMKNMTGQYNVKTQVYEWEYFSIMHMANYFFKMNE